MSKMQVFPKSNAKFIKEYKAGRITPDMVEMVGNINPDDTVFKVRLPLFDCYGDPTEETAILGLSVNQLKNEKVSRMDELTEHVREIDEYVPQQENLIRILEQIKSHKKGELKRVS